MTRVRVTPCVSGNGYARVQVRVPDWRTRAIPYPFPQCDGYSRVCRDQHFGQVSDHLTLLIHDDASLSGQQQPPRPPSLAANTSGGLSHSVLGNYNVNDPPHSRREHDDDLLSFHDDDPPPSRVGGCTSLLGNDDDCQHHPPSLQTRARGVLLFWSMTMTPSLATNTSMGCTPSVLGDNDDSDPLPHCKHERGVYFFCSGR
jgi:hypothetical protein